MRLLLLCLCGVCFVWCKSLNCLRGFKSISTKFSATTIERLRTMIFKSLSLFVCVLLRCCVCI